MCYKLSTPAQQKLREYLATFKFNIFDYHQYFHADGFTMPFLPITTSEAPTTVELGMWKLLPFWVKTYEDAKKYANTLNATGEDIFDKASYKTNILQHRCLLWVEGFFEPHHPSPKVTIPYFIHPTDGAPMSLGCVYSNWVNQESGEVIKTFSIITTPANELMTEIHNDKKRMPLIIPPDQRSKWLGKLTKDQIQGMIQPLPDGHLVAYRVSNMLYKKGTDTDFEGILKRVE